MTKEEVLNIISQGESLAIEFKGEEKSPLPDYELHKAVVCRKWGAPHFRHTYATYYYRKTKDIETLRRILCHSDISITTIYITLANIDVETGMKSFKGFV